MECLSAITGIRTGKAERDAADDKRTLN